MSGVQDYEGFYAIHNHMPGGDHALRVGGTVVFSTGGWSAALRAHESDGPTGINPFILYLELVLEPPGESTNVPQALTPVPLEEFKLEQPTLEYREVQFIIVGSDDEAPDRLQVEHPE